CPAPADSGSAVHDSTWRMFRSLCLQKKRSVWTNKRGANAPARDREKDPTKDRSRCRTQPPVRRGKQRFRMNRQQVQRKLRRSLPCKLWEDSGPRHAAIAYRLQPLIGWRQGRRKIALHQPAKDLEYIRKAIAFGHHFKNFIFAGQPAFPPFF